MITWPESEIEAALNTLDNWTADYRDRAEASKKVRDYITALRTRAALTPSPDHADLIGRLEEQADYEDRCADAVLDTNGAMLREAAAAIRALEGWKRQALAVEREWNPQAIAKLLNLKPGASIRAEIQPAIEALTASLSRVEGERNARLESQLLALLKGEHSSLHLTFNSENAPSYMTVAEVAEDDRFDVDWVSDEERAKSIAANRIWTLQWYPDTPIGSYSVSAASLLALLEHCLSRASDDGSNGGEGQ